MEIVDLQGRKGLVVDIANEHSLAWAAQHFRRADAELGITYRNDKAKSYVEPLARKVAATIILHVMLQRLTNSRPSLGPSRPHGAAWTSCFMRSLGRARMPFSAAFPIALRNALRRRC
jgi:hypothetical protein